MNSILQLSCTNCRHRVEVRVSTKALQLREINRTQVSGNFWYPIPDPPGSRQAPEGCGEDVRWLGAALPPCWFEAALRPGLSQRGGPEIEREAQGGASSASSSPARLLRPPHVSPLRPGACSLDSGRRDSRGSLSAEAEGTGLLRSGGLPGYGDRLGLRSEAARLRGEARGGAARASLPGAGEAWRRQVGRTRRERASERARAGARGAGGGAAAAAQLFLNIRAGVRRAGRAPSRRAVTRRLLRGARLRERPHRELARRGASDAFCAEDAGGGRASRVQHGPAGGSRGGPGPCGTPRPPARPRAPSPAVRPSLARSRRNMAAAAASASQDELSKCGAEPAASRGADSTRGRARRGPGDSRGAGPVGRRPRVAGFWGARAWPAGGLPPRALVGRRFALSRCEIETRAAGRAAFGRNPPRPGVWGDPHPS